MAAKAHYSASHHFSHTFILHSKAVSLGGWWPVAVPFSGLASGGPGSDRVYILIVHIQYKTFWAFDLSSPKADGVGRHSWDFEARPRCQTLQQFTMAAALKHFGCRFWDFIRWLGAWLVARGLY
jgi:hypothetical protein